MYFNGESQYTSNDTFANSFSFAFKTGHLDVTYGECLNRVTRIDLET